MSAAAVAPSKPMVREEPEKIKKWREDQKQRLEEKGKMLFYFFKFQENYILQYISTLLYIKYTSINIFTLLYVSVKLIQYLSAQTFIIVS